MNENDNNNRQPRCWSCLCPATLVIVRLLMAAISLSLSLSLSFSLFLDHKRRDHSLFCSARLRVRGIFYRSDWRRSPWGEPAWVDEIFEDETRPARRLHRSLLRALLVSPGKRNNYLSSADVQKCQAPRPLPLVIPVLSTIVHPRVSPWNYDRGFTVFLRYPFHASSTKSPRYSFPFFFFFGCRRLKERNTRWSRQRDEIDGIFD